VPVIAAIIAIAVGIVILTVFLRFDVLAINDDAGIFTELGYVFREATYGMTVIDWLGGGLGRILQNFVSASRYRFDLSFGSLLGTIIIGAVVILLFAQIAGLISRMIVKRKLKRKDTMYWFWAMIVKFFISLAFSLVFSILKAAAIFFFAWAFIPILLLWFFLGAIKNIIVMRTIYFRDRRFGELLTSKIIFTYLFASFLLVITVALVVVPIAIWVNFWIALTVIIPLYIYLSITVEFTTAAHFMEKFNKTE